MYTQTMDTHSLTFLRGFVCVGLSTLPTVIGSHWAHSAGARLARLVRLAIQSRACAPGYGYKPHRRDTVRCVPGSACEPAP